MRECIRCKAPMLDRYCLTVTNTTRKVELSEREEGTATMPISELKVALCPICGYVENYIEYVV